ncbi:bifunctional 4-hydroxy-2-oxoglutarate aldolase/2-dehydro-3-deoxy-phosphogluconate aldolase [Deinococcus sp.]|uniref:bifunctional 4-hydroxy-2-oxoglutarate aldolase/2-dehydro-3-deoxy-phosphogluconate aldolase n=1 Tax=Deinococcus sp. TaxID=47478 RepID=UPI003CC6CE70
MSGALPWPGRLVAVLRGTADAVLQDAERLHRAGVQALEVTFTVPDAAHIIRALKSRGIGAVGAGTLCTARQIEQARAAGADFGVSPGYLPALVDAARAAGLPYLPGVATPSEIMAACAQGCGALKLFPAEMVGIGGLRALLGPFPALSLVVSGGVTPVSAAEWLSAGAAGVGIGSALGQLDAAELTQLLAVTA